MALVPHTFLIDTNNTSIQTVQLHPMKSLPVQATSSSANLTSSTDVKFAVLVDSNLPTVDYEFVVCYTGKELDPSLNDYELTPIAYNIVDTGFSRRGGIICLATPKSNKKYTIELKFANGQISNTTMSILLNDVIMDSIGASQLAVKKHVNLCHMVNSPNETIVTMNVSEQFFVEYYGPFVIAIRRVPNFTSCAFKGI